jgi:DNA-binding MarR family transcriptional regulator
MQATNQTGGHMTEPGAGAVRLPGSDLAARLEVTFRLLGKRIYLASWRQLRTVNPGLDQASVPLLAALEEHDDARPSDVSAAVELDLSTVSRQLRQLERLGLARRRPDGKDGRACRLSLTGQGRDCLSAVRASRAAMLDEVFGDWPAAERRELLRLLDLLLAGLATLPGTAPPGATGPGTTLPAAALRTVTSPPNRESHA